MPRPIKRRPPTPDVTAADVRRMAEAGCLEYASRRVRGVARRHGEAAAEPLRAVLREMEDAELAAFARMGLR